MFNSHPEEAASGFPIDPPRPSQFVEEPNNGSPHKRASHSGPLVNRASWSNSGKNVVDAPKNLSMADLSAISGLAAARRSMLSEERREKSYSQQDVPQLISRFPGSFKESSKSTMRQEDDKHAGGESQQHDDERGSNNPVLLGYGWKGSKIHYSGPLMVPSGKVDQMLKDHDRQIQEAVRRARIDKARLRKMQAEGNQISTNS